MRLDHILKDSGAEIIQGSSRVEVDAIFSDSRKVTAGSMFVAIKGYAFDGHEYS